MSNILIYSNDSCNSLLQSIDNDYKILPFVHQFEQIQQITEKINMAIVVITQEMIFNKKFRMIFDIKCITKAPILAIIDSSSSRTILEVLNYGANDYLNYPPDSALLNLKITEMMRMARVCY